MPLRPLNRIVDSPFCRLDSSTPVDGKERAVTTPLTFGGRLRSLSARLPLFRRCAFAQQESQRNLRANTRFIADIHDELGEYEAAIARRLLDLDARPDRLIDGATAHQTLAALGEAKPRPRVDVATAGVPRLPRHSPPPEMTAGTADLPHGDFDPRVAMAKIGCLVTRETQDTELLLLRESASGKSLYLEKGSRVAESAELQQRALAASRWFDEEVRPSVTAEHPEAGQPVTAGELRRLSTVAYQAHVAPAYHAAGAVTAAREAPRTPTEVSMHWISALQEAARSALPADQAALISELLRQQKTRWLEHRLTVRDTYDALRGDSERLRTAGLDRLADIAAPAMTEPVGQPGGGLLAQLPASDEAIPLTRLHENIYGRVFESCWMAQLVEAPPPQVLSTMQAIGGGLADRVAGWPEKQRRGVIEGLQKLVAADPRFWFGSVDGYGEFAALAWPQADEALQRMLRAPVTDGAHAIAIGYLAVRIFVSVPKEARPAWMRRTNQNFGTHIGPRRQRVEWNGESNVPAEPTAGITLRHQPAAVSSPRWIATRRPALERMPMLPEISQNTAQALRRGVPFVSDLSGSMNIMLGLIDHLRAEGRDIDPRAGLLGEIMFLVHDGGHSIHEALWVAQQRDPSLGLALSDPRLPAGPDGFVADYARFIGLYGDSAVGACLARAQEQAWNDTIDYFRRNSFFSPAQPDPTST